MFSALLTGAVVSGIMVPAPPPRPLPDGTPSYLGVQFRAVENDKGEPVLAVDKVYKDSPAMKAGLKPGDLIAKLDSKKIGTLLLPDGGKLKGEDDDVVPDETLARIREYISGLKPGKTIALAVTRRGKPLDLKLKLAPRPKDFGLTPLPDDEEPIGEPPGIEPEVNGPNPVPPPLDPLPPLPPKD